MKLVVLWIFTVSTLTININHGEASDDYKKLCSKFLRSCRTISLKFKYPVSCENAFSKFILSFKGRTSKKMMVPLKNSPLIAGYYAAYFEATSFPSKHIIDTSLFWTKTKLVVQGLLALGADITTYDSVFSTSIIEHMRTKKAVNRWCSKTDRKILINANCRTFQAVYVFWAEAAKILAQMVIGNSFYLTAEAYFGEISLYSEQVLSTFLKVENLCTGITVINITPTNSTTICGTGRLARLEKAAKPILNYQCFDVFGDHYSPSMQLINCIDHLITSLSRGMSRCTKTHTHAHR